MRRALAAGLALSLAACATTQEPAVTPQAPAPPAVEAERTRRIETLYADLEAGVTAFVNAAESVTTDGLEPLADAQEALAALEEDCAATKGCDLGRFTTAQQGLLGMQFELLERQRERIAELETPPEPEMTELGAEAAPVLPQPEGSFTTDDSLDDILSLNGPIAKGVLTWVGYRRPDFIEAWTNWKLLESDLLPIYEAAGYPWQLGAAQKFQESHVKAHAGSWRGAVGTDQFIRSTGRKYGLKVVAGFDERRDPVKSTEAQIAYMQDLLDIFDGDYSLAIASYNGHSAYRAARRVRRSKPDATFWDRDIYHASRRETRDYVALVLGAAQILADPARFGFAEPDVDTTRQQLTLARDTTIDQLAFCLGDDPAAGSFGFYRSLRNMNPAFDVKDDIPEGTTIDVPGVAVERYAERCIDGPAVELAASLHEHAYPEYETYTVRRGDTLQRIGRRYGVMWGNIAHENGIRRPYVIHPGDVLIIPQE